MRVKWLVDDGSVYCFGWVGLCMGWVVFGVVWWFVCDLCRGSYYGFGVCYFLLGFCDVGIGLCVWCVLGIHVWCVSLAGLDSCYDFTLM